MAISIRLKDEDRDLIKASAKLEKLTISDYIRRIVLEHIEDQYDLQSYEEAHAEYLDDGKTYSQEEVERELGLCYMK